MTLLAILLCMDRICDQSAEVDTNPVLDFSCFSEQPLLPLIAKGEMAAVEQFVERYGGLIWSIARKSTRITHDAEDLVQEIFLDLWKNAASFRLDRGSEITFISVVARRRVVDRIRRRSSTIQVISLDEPPVNSVITGGLNSLEMADDVHKVRQCLEQLSARTREVLILILQDGMSHQEVAMSTCIPLGSVKSYARRGLIFLRDCVNRPSASNAQEAML
ncbi:MAG: RNA polymerase sigma factor [Pirellula sp.]|jgi:RNA polymerase sigma factor (sigma-70 family)